MSALAYTLDAATQRVFLHAAQPLEITDMTDRVVVGTWLTEDDLWFLHDLFMQMRPRTEQLGADAKGDL
jgi:hypothetical protein